jgi:hypothetical protein
MEDIEKLFARLFGQLDEPENDPADKAAESLYKLYSALITSGFEKDQAFEILLTTLENANK